MTHASIETTLTVTKPRIHPARLDPPTREDVARFAEKVAGDFIKYAEAQFDADLAWHGNWDRSALEYNVLYDMLFEAARGVLKEDE